MRALAIALGCACLAARAADDLPSTEAVRAALTAHPAVLAARQAVLEREAGRRALEAGSYELNLRLSGANRRERATGQDLREYEVGLERPLRTPGKASLDAELGRQGVAQAQLAVGEAMHETARELLRLWFEWLRAAAQAADWDAQAGLLARQLEVVDKRVRAGDAPRQERLLAESALAQAQAQALQARARSEAAAAQLASAFPGIAVPGAVPEVQAGALEQDLGEWQRRVLEHNHELAVARAESRRLRTAAARADANRTPDPTVGVRLGSERDDTERIVGFTFAIPFPGEARRAGADAALAESGVAAQREAGVLRRLQAQTASLHALARRAHEAARGAGQAAAGLQRNGELSERAYALGEVGLADVIAARRLAIESRLAATLARLEAAEARYRLMLDAHELWPIDATD